MLDDKKNTTLKMLNIFLNILEDCTHIDYTYNVYVNEHLVEHAVITAAAYRQWGKKMRPLMEVEEWYEC